MRSVKHRLVFVVFTAVTFWSLVRLMGFLYYTFRIPPHPIASLIGLFTMVFVLLPLSVGIVHWMFRVIREGS